MVENGVVFFIQKSNAKLRNINSAISIKNVSRHSSLTHLVFFKILENIDRTLHKIISKQVLFEHSLFYFYLSIRSGYERLA